MRRRLGLVRNITINTRSHLQTDFLEVGHQIGTHVVTVQVVCIGIV